MTIQTAARKSTRDKSIYNCEVLLHLSMSRVTKDEQTILKDYVKSFRPSKRVPAVQRYETHSREQAQVD
jgi:hypothetical protein